MRVRLSEAACEVARRDFEESSSRVMSRTDGQPAGSGSSLSGHAMVMQAGYDVFRQLREEN